MGRGDRVLQAEARVHAATHHVEQVGRATGEPGVVAVREPRHATAHPDVPRPQRVATVGHAGRGRRVRHQGDSVRAEEVEDHPHRLVVQVHPVGDQLHDGVPDGRRSQRTRNRARSPMVQWRHAVEQVRDQPGSAQRGTSVGEGTPDERR